jgi:hypothetical protein
MGMFDDVEVFVDLPIPNFITDKYVNIFKRTFEETGFQTKDFDNVLSHYFIFSDGQLYDSKRTFLPFKNVEVDLKNAEKVNFDGPLEIYTIVNIEDKDLFVAYELTFLDGKVSDMKWLDPTEQKFLDHIN